MSSSIEFIVTDETENKRLDAAVTHYCLSNGIELTRSSMKSREIEIMVNSKPEKHSYLVKIGDQISLIVPEVKPLEVTAQPVDFELLFSDNDIAVVNKPYGLTVHPSKGHEDGTLVNGLLFRLKGKLSSIGGIERPGIVHRLDKDTAGLLIIALNDQAHHKLSEDFRNRNIRKVYHAVVKGKTEEKGRIESPIGRSPNDRKKMAVVEDGRPSITEYRALEYLKDHTYVEINLLTGRTHQIRVHFSSINHPVAADPIYSRNASSYKMSGIALCAKSLSFKHPVTGEQMDFTIELPVEMQALIKRYRI